MNQVADSLTSAQRIYFLGIGGSGLVAREAAQRFLSLGFTSIAVFEPYEQVFATSRSEFWYSVDAASCRIYFFP
jgi:DNA-binding MurR/RpiR family transcriptional regulator